MNLAVIDLGSNTFHLVVVQYNVDNGFLELYRERVYARLARSGIGVITEVAFEKGLKTLLHFKEILLQHNVVKSKIVGTEMLRIAPNGADFVRKVHDQTGFSIEIISGEQEADYIFQGVQHSFPNATYLIVDVGGGSVEFIIVKDGNREWLTSVPIGIAVLYFQYKQSDPIEQEELLKIESFLNQQLMSLRQQLNNYNIEVLVGASGVFETFFDVEGEAFDSYLDASSFKIKLASMIHSKLEEREAMSSIPKVRKKMMVVAAILVKAVLDGTSIKRIRFSPNSLKEGLLYELLLNV